MNGNVTATVDLDYGVRETPLGRIFATGDAQAHQFVIKVNRSGQPAALDGAGVSCYFLRADHQTVIITGSAEGNTARVTLPASCYAVEGCFQMAVKVSSGDEHTTVFLGQGYVVRTTTDAIVDPGGTIPSLDELLAQITQIEAAAKNANSAAEEARKAATQASGVIEDAQTAADGANAAKQSANEAAQAAQGAATAAQKAAKSASEAAGNVDDAIREAQEAAGAAMSAASDVDEAKSAAQEAATQASDAAQSAKTAAGQADAAASKASDAATQAAEAAAGADEAKQSANDAAAQATDAAGEASTAAGQATQAAQDASDAAEQASGAAQTATQSAASADEAATKATEAATKADTAATGANDAAQAAKAAESAANDAAANAQEKADYIGNMTVISHDVGPDTPASATKSDVDGHLQIDFGLRQGAKGEPGAPNIIKGKAYDSLEALQEGVPEPAEGDQYNVGEAPPYNVYRYTGEEWEDQGKTQGPQGEDGVSAGFGAADATVEQEGEPGCTVTTDGPASAVNFHFAFTGLRGEKGADGIGMGTITVTSDNTSSETPTCAVTSEDAGAVRNYTLAFAGLKGKDGTQVDLSGYVQTAELEGYVKREELIAITNEEIDAMFAQGGD